ncbi:MAG: hypothetical protein ACK4VI_04265 [Alphaproteobacteria bacterium]
MRILFLLSAFLIIVAINPSIASISIPAPECAITGLVLNQENRDQAGGGISEGKTFRYQDLQIKIIEINYSENGKDGAMINDAKPYNCDFVSDEKITYQIRDYSESKNKSLLGECIQANTKYMADGNFMSGNWIYNIAVIEQAFCNQIAK